MEKQNIPNPKVCIIILNYNSWQTTIEAIKNIENTLEYDRLEVVIVDNCSTNDSYKKLSEFVEVFSLKYTLYIIKSPVNGGYAAGNNIGVRKSISIEAEFSLIINNDILFIQKDTIQQLVGCMTNNENIGAVSPRIISKDGSHDKPIYYKKPSFWDLSIGIKSYVDAIKLQNDELVYEIYAPRGCCMILRNSDFERIGFLDEATFLYYEEPILAERMLRIGKHCLNYGKVCVIHNHAVTIKNNISRKKSREILVKSLEYYLLQYRKFNKIQRYICCYIRKFAYLISKK